MGIYKYGESNYFICVEVLRRFSQQTYYDELLFLDADVLVLPGCPNIFEFLGSMAMADDWYIPTQDGHFENWLNAHIGESALFVPGAPYFNSGVIVISREAAARIDYSGPYPDVPWYDQDWINYQVARAGITVENLDGAWNYRALENPEEAIANGHFLHFCGDAQAKARISEFTRLLA